MKVTKIISHSSDGEMLSLYVEIEAKSGVIVEHKEKEIEEDNSFKGILFYDKYTDGTYQYGLKALVPYMNHGVGYIWSSRASVINEVFGTKLVDVAIKTPDEQFYWSCAIELDQIEMPEGFSIVEKQFSSGEKYYSTVRDIPFSDEEKNWTLCGKTLYSCLDDDVPTDTVYNLTVCNQ